MNQQVPLNQPIPEGTSFRPVNPLLERIRMPGETFRIPSGGLFYNNGELASDVKDGEVYVYPMTAIDEIMIKTPDLLYSGKAVQEVFGRCIPQVIKPMELLARDVDFLLICLRKVSFGSEMEILHTHTCENAKEHSYVITMDSFIKQSKRIDPTTIASQYTCTLENGQVVEMQPVNYQHFVEMMQANDVDFKDPQVAKTFMLSTILSIIVSVDGIKDKGMIAEWLDRLPVRELHTINDKIEKTVEWGPTFETTITCRDCGKPSKVTAPLNPVAFFT